MPYGGKTKKNYPTKARIQEFLDELTGEAYEAFDGYLEDQGVGDTYDLTLSQLRVAYDRFIRNWAPESRTDNETYNIDPKEFAVESFTATIIIDKSRRVANIHIEDGDGKFLTADLERHERALGTEMPVYRSIPQEIYEAIKRA